MFFNGRKGKKFGGRMVICELWELTSRIVVSRWIR